MKIAAFFHSVFHSVAQYFRQNDNVILFSSVIAAVIGYFLVYSATYSLGRVDRLMLVQTIAIAIGIVCMIVLSLIDYHLIARFWKIIAVVAVLLLIATLVIGSGRDNVNEKSWIKFGSLSVQPSEFVKIAFILTFSKHIEWVKDEINKPKNILLLLFHAAIPIALILKENDFGMTLVFLFIFISMLFAANVRLRYFVGAAIAGLVCAPIVWTHLGTRQTGRILALFDPTNTKYASYAYQQTKSVAAIGSGEVWGYGLLNGPMTQKSLIPEKQNDMIFAVTGEELGFVGCMLVIIVLTVLLVKILLAARRSKDMLGAEICIGVFACFAIQVVLNIGMCLFLVPVIGLTLPFMSYGGTSILSSFLAVGLVLSVAKKESTMLFT